MRTYDLLNAGPRHRFLIRNRDKQPLLVSNCSQGIAGDFIANGACTADDAGFIIWSLIHDQALARSEGKSRLAEFTRCLTNLPDWAKDFPLKADVDEAPFYRKEP